MFDNSPMPGKIFINVWNCSASIARWMFVGSNLTWIAAKNAEQLEDEAEAAVEAQGGAVNMSGHYACPEELAVRAIFANESE